MKNSEQLLEFWEPTPAQVFPKVLMMSDSDREVTGIATGSIRYDMPNRQLRLMTRSGWITMRDFREEEMYEEF